MKADVQLFGNSWSTKETGVQLEGRTDVLLEARQYIFLQWVKAWHQGFNFDVSTNSNKLGFNVRLGPVWFLGENTRYDDETWREHELALSVGDSTKRLTVAHYDLVDPREILTLRTKREKTALAQISLSPS